MNKEWTCKVCDEKIPHGIEYLVDGDTALCPHCMRLHVNGWVNKCDGCGGYYRSEEMSSTGGSQIFCGPCYNDEIKEQDDYERVHG
jgi:hypothetical protein